MFIICYIMILSVQAVNLTLITALVLPYKRKISILYTFLTHISIILTIDVMRLITNDETYALVFIAANLIDILIPFLFAKHFVKSLLWKSSLCYLLTGILSNLAFHIILMLTPLGNDTLTAYLSENWRSFTLPGALIYVAASLAGFFLVSLTARKFIRTDRQSAEKFYKIIYIAIAIILIVSDIITRLNQGYSGERYAIFWTIVIPVIYILAMAGVIAFFIYSDKKRNEELYRKAFSSEKSERGDSNKEIRLFLDDELNRYLNEKVKALKDSGKAVDVISYISDRISAPINVSAMISLLDSVFDNIIQSKVTHSPYAIICFRLQNDRLVIHFEYSKASSISLIKKLFSREYLYIYDYYYRLDETGILRDEITFLFQ